MSEKLRYRIAVVDARDWFGLKVEINKEVQDNERIVAVQYDAVERGPEEWSTTWKQAVLTLESTIEKQGGYIRDCEEEGQEDPARHHSGDR